MQENTQDQVTQLGVVLNELDEFAAAWNANLRGRGSWQCRRQRHRRVLRTPCEIWFYEYGGMSIRHLSALTRNISEQGLGLIVRCVVLQGTPIEVRIDAPSRPSTHLAGIVAHCRYTAQSYHEVGITLKAYQSEPIFCEDPLKAASSISWIQKALRDVLRTGRASVS